MIKKHLIFATMLLLMTFVHANNIYVGGGLGYTQLTSKINSIWSISSLSEFPITGLGLAVNGSGDISSKISGDGINGNLFIGYGINDYKPFYLGGELVGFLASSESSYTESINLTNDWFNLINPNARLFSQQGDQIRIKNKLQKGYSLRLRPGYSLIDKVILYGIAAFTRSEFKFSLEQGEGGFIIGQEQGGSRIRGDASFSRTAWRNGIGYGLGLEMALIKRFSARLQIIQTRYQSYTTSSQDTSQGATDENGPYSANATNSITFKPIDTTAEINLVYKFG